MSRRFATVLAGAALILASGCGGDRLTPPPGLGGPRVNTVVDLALGEFVRVRPGQLGGSIEIPDADASRSYVVVVQNASDRATGPVRLRVGVTPIQAVSLSERPAGMSVAGPAASAGRAGPFDRWWSGGESAFRDRVAGTLRARGARPSQRAVAQGPTGVRASVAASVPAVGETLQFGSPVNADGGLSTCTSTQRVTGEVRAVGSHVALVEDTRVAGRFSDADYAGFLAEIEDIGIPVTEAYFGRPLDIDGNGRVIVLVTAEVNRLGAAGFFTISDLMAREDCPAGNEGEVLWLVAPDPAREFGFDPIPTSLVRSRLPGIVVHELQHLIHAERRVFEAGGDFDAVDELWLNEGMSHVAEEVAGLYRAGRRTGENLELPHLGSPVFRAIFDRYHASDFRFVRDYFEAPGDVPALVDTPITRGALRRARGFGYLFLRWIADRYASDGPPGLVGSVDEEAFFRELTLGGAAGRRSIANLLGSLRDAAGVSREWDELFAEYVASPAVDDVAAPNVPLAPALRLTTWNLPLAYENARDNGYALDFPSGFPLAPRLLRLESLPIPGYETSIELLPSTAAYFRLEGSFETPLARIVITGADGEPLEPGSGIQVTIVRTL